MRRPNTLTSLEILALVGAGVLVALLVLAQMNAAREASDAFWRTLQIRGSEIEQYETLDSMVLSADAVVIGQVVSVRAGRILGDPEPSFADPSEAQAHYATLTVEVFEVLAGSLPAEHSVRVSLEVLMRRSQDVDVLISTIPKEDEVFFLRSKGLEATRLGLPASVVEQEQSFYRLVVVHALLRIFDGEVEPAFGADEPFLLGLDGKPVTDVLADIRSAGLQ